MVFQEFKRSYLKGIIGDDDDEEGNVSGGDDMAPKEKQTRQSVKMATAETSSWETGSAQSLCQKKNIDN